MPCVEIAALLVPDARCCIVEWDCPSLRCAYFIMRFIAVASARFFAFCIVDAAFSFTYSCGLLFNSILCSAFRKVFLLPHCVAVPYLCQHSPGFGEFTLCGHNTDGLRLLLRITRASSGGLNEVSGRLHGKQRLISIKSAVVLCGRLLDAGEFGYR
ncbi:conserved hypothetical protein [Trichinella spiralis]|uniref:hypothetical protein n=1 Tax=Trichinella spiralis TaxID=6334 RepID=UPI0001EFE9F5|nr:conserved hypothetical protein [Trichinella spiralis]